MTTKVKIHSNSLTLGLLA